MARRPSRIVTAVLACAATTVISWNALAQGQAATAGDTKQVPLPADMNVQFDRAVAAKTQPTPPDPVKDVERAIGLGNEMDSSGARAAASLRGVTGR